jgi:glycosyltransferase involved in cell wall biosynthesis
MSEAAPAAPRVMVVGSGWRFTSGISYYTCSLANAFSAEAPTDALLLRQLLPTLLYPGRKRVGQPVNSLQYAPSVGVFDGLDWFWGRTMTDATRFIETRRPDVLVLQWWTGAVMHSYLHLAAVARRHGIKVVMEWHEVQDTGEAGIPGVRQYVRWAMRRLLDRVDAHVVHSRYDLDLLRQAYSLGDEVTSRAAVVPHGPYDHARGDVATPPTPVAADRTVTSEQPFNILFFGVIRPYKGLEDLVEAFAALPADVRDGLHLTIVGETWEGWHAPLDAVAASPVPDQITVVNRYVTDEEATRHFAAADAVALPYRRSSSSGPLHMAMSVGLPVIVTDVGGLVDAAAGYEGVTFVPPADVPALTAALTTITEQRGMRYVDARSWDTTIAAYRALFHDLGLGSSSQDDSHDLLDSSPTTTGRYR